MQKVYYIYEVGDGFEEQVEAKAVASLEDVPSKVTRVGVFVRESCLKRQSNWTKEGK